MLKGEFLIYILVMKNAHLILFSMIVPRKCYDNILINKLCSETVEYCYYEYTDSGTIDSIVSDYVHALSISLFLIFAQLKKYFKLGIIFQDTLSILCWARM
jgi:hypothetical protein